MDVSLFRDWLKYCLSDVGKSELIEGYAESRLSEFAGFMTYRFVSMSSEYNEWSTIGRHINNERDLNAFFDSYSVVHRFVRMERIDQDLLLILRDVGYDLTEGFSNSLEPMNASEHLEFGCYYDCETENLVSAQEKFIIERFHYAAPGEKKDSSRC